MSLTDTQRYNLYAFIDRYDIEHGNVLAEHIDSSQVDADFINDFVEQFLPEGQSADPRAVHEFASELCDYMDMQDAQEFVAGLYDHCHPGFQSVLCQSHERAFIEAPETVDIDETGFSSAIESAISEISQINPETGARLQQMFHTGGIAYDPLNDPSAPEAYVHALLPDQITFTNNAHLDRYHPEPSTQREPLNQTNYRYSRLERTLNDDNRSSQDTIERNDLPPPDPRLAGCHPNHLQLQLVHEETHVLQHDPQSLLNLENSGPAGYNFAISVLLYMAPHFSDSHVHEEYYTALQNEGLMQVFSLAHREMEREAMATADEYIMDYCISQYVQTHAPQPLEQPTQNTWGRVYNWFLTRDSTILTRAHGNFQHS